MPTAKFDWGLAGVVAASATAIFMANLDTTIVNVVLPTLAGNLGVNPVSISQVNLAYLLALTASLLIFGRLCDTMGPERVFTAGFVVFTLGSGLCAAAGGLTDLVAYRFVQGMGGAMFFASSAAIIVKYVPRTSRGKAFGMNGLAAGIGFAAGSPLGGWLVNWGWRWIFLINIPVGLAGTLLCMRFLKNPPARHRDQPFDIMGAVFSFIFLAALIMFFQDGGRYGWHKPLVGVWLILILVAGALFYRRERAAADPLLPLALFLNKSLSAALFSNFAYLMLLYGISLVLPFYFHYVRGLSPAVTGRYLAIFPLVSIFVSPLTGHLCDRIGPKRICVAAMTLFVAATVLLTTFNAATTDSFIIGAFLLFGLAMALFCTASMTLVMSHAGRDNAGILSSVKSVIPNLGGMLGVSMFPVIFAHGIKRAGLMVEQAGDDLLVAGFQRAMLLGTGVAVAGLLLVLAAKAGQPSPAS